MLPAVEEAGGEEDHCDQEGQLGVLRRMQAQADEAVDDPDGAACEPYPCEVSHDR